MNNNTPVIDVWMQHPNLPFINHPMFASLRRWMGMDTFTEEIPAESTIAAMTQAGVAKGMLYAWWEPSGPLISNEEIKSEVAIDFPELRMICGHIGYPWTTEMIAVATKHPNVFIDTSAYTAKRMIPVAPDACQPAVLHRQNHPAAGVTFKTYGSYLRRHFRFLYDRFLCLSGFKKKLWERHPSANFAD